MKMIFGLGNFGSQYAKTRHNLGFAVADRLAHDHSLSFDEKSKFKAYIAEGSVAGEKVILVKPTTFYNLVGESFRALLDFYKLAPEDVLIVHDDLALPFGTLRVREGGSDAGNNGIKSINQHGGEETFRLRIGVATQQRTVMGDTDFVLGRFSTAEANGVAEHLLPAAIDVIDDFIQGNHSITSRTVID